MMQTTDQADRGDGRAFPRWMGRVLVAAGVYNLLWGAWAILTPSLAFRWAGMDPPNHLFLWQCIGMIVGVYGIGYLLASRDPVRHWPIVLVGLLGKVLGPIGFVDALVRGAVTPAFGLNIIFNDLVWWVPFGLILWHAARWSQAPRQTSAEIPPAEVALRMFRLSGGPSDGASVAEASEAQPLLLVFLRHLGCTFCREALADLVRERPSIERSGVRVVLVHMSPAGDAMAFFARYGLGDVSHVSDPEAVLYRSMGLKRGSFGQLFGPRVWLAGVKAAMRGHGVGALKGDGFRMPGVFLVSGGRVIREFRHRDAGERPDYRELARCDLPAASAGG